MGAYEQFLRGRMPRFQQQPVIPVPLPQAVYNGGGSGVYANDILGQYGPVVVGPQYQTSQPQTNTSAPGVVPMTEQDAQHQALMAAQIAMASQMAAAQQVPVPPPPRPMSPMAAPDFSAPAPLGMMTGLSPRGPVAQPYSQDAEWQYAMAYTGGDPAAAMQTIQQWRQDAATQQATQATRAAVTAAGSPGIDPVGSAIGTAADTTADAVGSAVVPVSTALSYPKSKTDEAWSYAVYQIAKSMGPDASGDSILAQVVKDLPVIGPRLQQTIGSQDNKAYFDGLIDAYEHGYTAYGAPNAGGPSPEGPTGIDRPIVAQYGPGAQAAHEYIVGQMPWWARATFDVLLDPVNIALAPTAGVGESLAEAGSRMAGEGVIKAAADEGVGAATKAAAGRVAQVVGTGLQVPDIVLNQAADHALNTAGSLVKESISGTPIGRTVDYLAGTPIRIKGRIAGEDSLNTMAAEDAIRANAASATTDIGDVAPWPVTPPAPNGTMADIPILGQGARQVPPTMTAEDRIAAVTEGRLNLFDPTPQGARLVDDAQAAERAANETTVRQARRFEEVNAPKRAKAWADDRALETEIKDLQRERNNLPSGPEREAVHAQVETKIVDQAINGVEHTVYDVAHDYKTSFGTLPEIPLSSKRVSIERLNRIGDEVLVGGERTPDGNLMKVSKDPLGPGNKYEIVGKDGEKTVVVKGQDGKWIVKQKKAVIGRGLSDAKAIELSDKNLIPAEASHLEQTTNWLIERAVYGDDNGALNVLKERITPAQVKRVENAQEYLWGIRHDVDEFIPGDIQAPPGYPKLGTTYRNPMETVDSARWQEFERRTDASGNDLTGKAYYDGPQRSLWNKAAKQTTREDSLRVVDDWAKRWGPRDKAYRPGRRTDFHGNLIKDQKSVYEATKAGRAWKLADQLKEDINTAWDSAVGEPSLEGVRQPPRYQMKRVEMGSAPTMEPPSVESAVPGEPTPPVEPAAPIFEPHIPDDIQQAMDVERFTGSAEPLHKGKTLRQVRDTIEAKAATDQARAQQLVAEIAADKQALGLDPTTPLDVPGKALKSRPTVGKAEAKIIAKERELAGLQARYNPRLIGDIVTGDTHDIANRSAALAKQHDIDPSLFKKPRLATDLLDALLFRSQRHLALMLPSYTGRNVIGNVISSTVGTEGRNADLIMEHFRTAFEQGPGFADRMAEDAGQGGLHPQYSKHGPAGLDLTTTGSDTPTRLLAKKLKAPEYVARGFDKIKDFNAGLEYGAKVVLGWSAAFRSLVTDSMATAAKELTDYAAKRGIAFDDGELLDLMMGLRNEETRVFNAAELSQAVKDAALTKGADDAAARKMAQTSFDKWTHAVREANNEAVRQTNRIFPSIRRMTELDRIASRVFFFHLWPTRMSRFVLEEMVRHPQLYHLYREAHQGLSRMAEEGDYPASVRMLMHVADSPFGFTLFADPRSMFLVTMLQPDTPTVQDPEHMTRLGHAIKEMKDKTGLGFVPMLDAALNVAGVYGNAFPPAPWPSTTVDLAQAAVDAALVKMGHHPTDPVWQNAMVWLRQQGSGIVPGTSKIMATNQGAYTMDIVGSIVLDNNPDLASRMAQVDDQGHPTSDALAAQREYGAIMDNPDDPEYVKAETQAAEQNVFTRVINAISPFSIKAKLLSRETTLDAAHAGTATATSGGAMTPLEAGAKQVRQAVTQTPEANELDSQVGEYHLIGTERQQALGDGWQVVAFGNFDQGATITVGGRAYTHAEVMAMDQKTRYALADNWVAENGGTQEFANYRKVQQQYVANHPVFKGYQDYKTQISKSPLGEDGWIALTRKYNPNYDAYLSEQELQYGTDAGTAAFTPSAYLAWKGTKRSLYEGNPQSVRDTSDLPFNANEVTGGAGSTGTGGATTTDSRPQRLADSITRYQANMAAVQQYLPKTVSWEDMSPSQRSAYAEALRRQGVTIPSMPTTVENYYTWANTRNPGDDTSVDAYFAWLDAMDKKLGLPTGTDLPVSDMAPASTQDAYQPYYTGPVGGASLNRDRSYAPIGSSYYNPIQGFSQPIGR